MTTEWTDLAAQAHSVRGPCTGFRRHAPHFGVPGNLRPTHHESGMGLLPLEADAGKILFSQGSLSFSTPGSTEWRTVRPGRSSSTRSSHHLRSARYCRDLLL
jgi:hypothetical protein